MLAFNSFSLLSNKDPLTKAICQSKKIKYVTGDKEIFPDGDFDSLFKCSPEFRLRKSTNVLSPKVINLNAETEISNNQQFESERTEEKKIKTDKTNLEEVNNNKQQVETYKYEFYCDDNSACQIPKGRNLNFFLI